MTDERIAIVGAGMAGLACAERLVRGGRQVVLFDKGRRVEAAGSVVLDELRSNVDK